MGPSEPPEPDAGPLPTTAPGPAAAPVFEWVSVRDLLARSCRAPLAVFGSARALSDERVLAALPGAVRGVAGAFARDASGGGEPGCDGLRTTTTWTGATLGSRVFLAVLPRSAERHAAACRPDALTDALRRARRELGDGFRALVVGDVGEDVMPFVAAAARGCVTGPRRDPSRPSPRLALGLLGRRDTLDEVAAVDRCRGPFLRDAVAGAMALQDEPARSLTTDAFVALARARGSFLGVDVEVFAGDELRTEGLDGLWSVGRAAANPPALVVLSHGAAQGRHRSGVGWVGKGIVFDSGGLSLKRPKEMRGMKADMSGAAAALEAFTAAVRLGAPGPLHAVLCIAENAIGPDALRPDDVVTMHSGRTVEITDTDAEGRLAVADGASWLVGRHPIAELVTLTTLTDAAPVATGRRHAAIVSDDAELEARGVAAGRRVGDLVHPLPYAPELARRALHSEVADMVNAADGPDLGVSVAAQFIREQLPDLPRGWIHLDMEGTARDARGRGTGFGVAWLLALLGAL